MYGNAAIDLRPHPHVSSTDRRMASPALLALFADDHRIYLSGDERVGRQLEHTILKAHDDGIYHLECAASKTRTIAFDLDLDPARANELAEQPLPGFVSGTRIETPIGPIPVEQLKTGDLVLTADGDAHAVLWQSRQSYSSRQLQNNPGLQPILIRKDALAHGLPAADLLISPNQRVLIDDWRAELMFGEAGVLVSAVALIDDNQIRRAAIQSEVTYHSLLLEDHRIVAAEGLATDSLFPDERTIAGLSPSDQNSLMIAIPDMGLADNTRATRHPVLSAAESLALLGG